MPKKCSCIAISTGKKCRTKTTHIYGDKHICYIHANKMLGKYVLLIQKTYIGYRTRKKLTIIYNKLPNEIQDIILSHMRQDHYNKKYIESLKKIIIKRYYSIFTDNPYIIFNHSIIPNNINYYYEIIKICNLFCKYKLILPKMFLYLLYINLPEIIYYYQSYLKNIPEYTDELEITSIHLYNTLRLYKIVCEDELKLLPYQRIMLYMGF